MSGFGDYNDWNDWNSMESHSELSSDLGFAQGEAFTEEVESLPFADPPPQSDLSGLFDRKKSSSTTTTSSEDAERQGFFSRLFSGGSSSSSSSSSSVVSPMAYRDVEGSGGYTYRQWSNGDIAILAGALPAGWSYDVPGPRDAAYTAIRAEIGSYPTTSSASSSSSSSSSSKKKSKITDKQKSQLAEAGKTLVSTAVSVYRDATATPTSTGSAPASETNWPLIIGGSLAGVVLIGGVWYLVSKRNKNSQ